MKKKAVSGFMITLIVVSMLTLAFNIQQVKAIETIYIRADGSIDPPSANITSSDNITYTFTDKIHGAIVVERSNIVIDGNGSTLQDPGIGSLKGFDLLDVENVTIQNATIKDFAFGVYLWGYSAFNNTVSGNTITNGAYGVRLDSGSYNNTVSGNNITNNTVYGVYLGHCNDNTVSGNNITNNPNIGVYLGGLCIDNTVSGNNITNSDECICLDSGHHNIISGNTITNGAYGVRLDSGSYNTVSGNNITNNTDEGVYLTSLSSNNTVSGNTITNHTPSNSYGVRIVTSSYNNTVSGNNITDNWGGVAIHGYENTVSRNNITNCNRGVYASGNDNTFSENTINSSSRGVRIYDAWADTFSGNVITNSTEYGVHIERGDVNRFSGNVITNSTIRGVYIQDGFGNRFSGNVITNSTGSLLSDGVLIYGGGGNIISGNNITNNEHRGVYILDSGYTIVAGNNITSNSGHGVMINDASYCKVFGNTITNNGWDGIQLYSFSSIIYANNIKNNSLGVRVFHASGCTVSENNITDNELGVNVDQASDNWLYHNNFINNTQQVDIDWPGYTNFWNSSYPSGGNYWSNYTGVDQKSGPNQNETGSDGIGDTPHILDAWNQDNYPFMELCKEQGTHDVGISVSAPSPFNEGDLVPIIVTVGNWGTFTENVGVEVTVDSVAVGNETVPGLFAGDDARLSYTWTAPEVDANWNYTITATATIVGYDDENPGDNTATRTIYKAVKTIYIRADGSIDPPSANITSSDNITYTFTDNMRGEIVVERSNIVIDGNGSTLQGSRSGTGFSLSNADNVTIQNATIKDFGSGVYLWGYSAFNNTVSGNNITNSGYGVYLSSSCDNNTVSGNNITNNERGVQIDGLGNTVSGNTITNHHGGVSIYGSYNTVSGNNITNSHHGVYVCGGYRNTVSGNNITDSTYGVWIYYTWENTFSGNTIINSSSRGVYIDDGWLNTFSGNVITNSFDGVYIERGDGNRFSGNVITNSSSRGVYFDSALGNVLSGNVITNSFRGVLIDEGSYSVLISNVITNSTWGGVYLWEVIRCTVRGNNITDNELGVNVDQASDNWLYHNNFINNTQQVDISTPGYTNFWNSSYPSGGNYWSNYTGGDQKSGPNQNETGSDGIGDTPHILDAWNQDNYPYMNETGWGRVRNINTTLGYWTIQEAIDAFQTLDGHTIQVDAGTYVENVDVSKQLSIIGAGADVTTVETYDPNDHVFYVTADNVTISGFTVMNATGSEKAGVCLYYSDYSRIENINASNNYCGIHLYWSLHNTFSGNNASSNDYGIWLNGSAYNTFSGNNASSNNYCGIYLESSSDFNTFSGNNVSSNNNYGIYLGSSSDNTLSGNTASLHTLGIFLDVSDFNNLTGNNAFNNGYGIRLSGSNDNNLTGNNASANNYGIYLSGSGNNTLSGNNASANNEFGIWLSGSSDNTLTGNNASSNNNYGIYIKTSDYNTLTGNNASSNNNYGIFLDVSDFNNLTGNNAFNNGYGIRLSGSSDNTLTGNTASANNYGIYLTGSSDNTFSGNNASNNSGTGIYLHYSSNNVLFHNNLIDNAVQASVTAGYVNIWDDGYPSGGNYWSNYTGVDLYSGPNQNETGSDGIGDTPHIFDAWNQDNYPYMNKDRSIQVPDPTGGQDDIGLKTNATVTHAVATRNTLNFNITGTAGQTAYVNVTIPMGLNKTAITVFVDGVELEYPPWPEITSNGTHYFVYFEYTLSTHEITIHYATADTAITNVAPHETVVGEGCTLNINATIQNQGNNTETFNVTLYGTNTPTPGQWQTFWSMGDVNEDGYINMTDYNLIVDHFGTSDPQYDINESGFVDITDIGICTPNLGKDIWTHFGLTLTVEEQTVNNLPAGNSTTITFTWNTTGVSYGNYTISAVADTILGETDTTDNTFVDGKVFVTIPGDINGDGVVNFDDFVIFSGKYGSQKGDPTYDSRCDINGDDSINFNDFVIFSGKYGQSI